MPITFSRDFDRSFDINSGFGPALTYARSGASKAHINGVLTSLAENIPPLRSTFFDGVAHVPRGLHVEKAATNILEKTDFADGFFVFTRTTRGDTEVRLGYTGQEVKDVSGSNNTHRISAVEGVTNAVTYTYSWIARAGQSTPFVFFDSTATSVGRSYFDLVNGVVGSRDNAHDAIGVLPIGEDLMLCWVVFTANQGTGDKSITINMSEADLDNAFPGDGLHRVWLYDVMLEVGDFPSSRVAAFATRAAPTVTAALVPGAETTIYVEGFTGYDAGVILQIDDGDENERFRIERDASNAIIVTVTDGSVEQVAIDAGDVADDTFFRLAVGFAAGNFAASLSGAAVVTDEAGTIPDMTTIRVGHDTAAGEEFYGHVGKVRVYDTLFTDGELIQLATVGPSEAQSQRISMGLGVGI